jgi:WD40 repeat protein
MIRYDSATGDIVKRFSGHREIVNVSIMHSYLPLVASSGIDNEIRLWKYKHRGGKGGQCG